MSIGSSQSHAFAARFSCGDAPSPGPGRARLLPVALCLAALGCGRSGLPPTVPVKGRVTFAGGECPHEGHVFFVPASDTPGGGQSPRAGMGPFGRDGGYTVTTLVPRDGLVPGSYTVRLVCELPADDDSSRGHSFVPVGFVLPALTVSAATGPLTHDIDVPRVVAPPPAKEAR
jgi:hypothetical protein